MNIGFFHLKNLFQFFPESQWYLEDKNITTMDQSLSITTHIHASSIYYGKCSYNMYVIMVSLSYISLESK